MCWPPAPGRAKRVDAQVRRIDLDFDGVVDFRVDEHARERRVPARVRIERALAHEPMDADLGAQIPVGIVAADLDRSALDAGHFSRGLLEHFGPIALALAVADVHPLEHRRPVLRFGAARARLDVDEARRRVHRVAEHPAKLHLADGLFDAGDVALEGIAAWRRRCRRGRGRRAPRCPEARIQRAQHVDDVLQRLLFLAERLRPLGIVPDLRVFELARDFGEPHRLHIEVKDTSADRPCARRGSRSRRRSG